MVKSNIENCDFSGWATRNDLKCSDGRVIRRDAFAHCDGMTVPLIWNHQHDDPSAVMGHAVLENREDGVYTYGFFNSNPKGLEGKEMVAHGDIDSLSIYANRLQQQGDNVIHGDIREVSLVLAGANPGAYIDSVMVHSDDFDDEGVIYTGMSIELKHSEDNDAKEELSHSEDKKDDKADEEKKPAEEKKDDKPAKEKTVGDIINTMNEEQKTVMYSLIGQALEDQKDDNSKEDTNMKHNVFENDNKPQENVLAHADQMDIVDLAKNKTIGTLKNAIDVYTQENETLAHGFESIESLFPDFENMMPGAPEKIPENDAWVSEVMSGAHKTPFSRIRTRQADVSAIKAGGYKNKGTKKKDIGNISLVTRTTDPQTVYIKDKMNRDDIVDITDFDPIQYEYGVMKSALNEEIATAILIGDGREPGDEQKIETTHIRPIWQDDELYTIHKDIDVAAMKNELQGTNTGANFGDSFVYAEAIITAALYAREGYKGAGNMSMFCAPHMVNQMLLARDMNGHRLYNSKADLARALNVKSIVEVEKFEGLTRKTSDEMPKTKKLLALFVNMADYNIGAVRKGQVTSFNDFDIDFNQEKFLIETRLSGALTRVKSAIALEEPVEA